jgi:hypothetical protein
LHVDEWKLIMIQLELNGIGYKLVFHNYSKFASNTWHTLICKFEKDKANPINYRGINIYSLLNFKKKEKLEKKFENKK